MRARASAYGYYYTECNLYVASALDRSFAIFPAAVAQLFSLSRSLFLIYISLPTHICTHTQASREKDAAEPMAKRPKTDIYRKRARKERGSERDGTRKKRRRQGVGEGENRGNKGVEKLSF